MHLKHQEKCLTVNESHVEFVQWRKCSLNTDPTPFGISMVSHVRRLHLREIVLKYYFQENYIRAIMNQKKKKNRRDYLILEYQSRQASNSELCSVMLTSPTMLNPPAHYHHCHPKYSPF
jgi:hypothetical protein